jgi:hypothetical protein
MEGKPIGGGASLGMRGAADGASTGGGRSDDAIAKKNCRRRQSTRGEAEGEVDDHRKNGHADDACRHGAEVDYNRCNRFGGERDDADDDRGLRHRLVLISRANFMPLSDGEYQEKQKNLRKRAEKAPGRKEGIQGQCRRQKLRRRLLHGSW